MSEVTKESGLVVCDHCPEFPHPLNDDNTPCKHPRPAPKVKSSLASLKDAKLLLQSVLMEWAHQGVWNEKVCPRCEKHALPSNDLCLIHTIFEFLGIDPNQPLSPEEEREWSKSRAAYLKSIKSGE